MFGDVRPEGRTRRLNYLRRFPAALRFTLYAMATACLRGLPARTSARTLLENAFLDVDFFSGMSILQFFRFVLTQHTPVLGISAIVTHPVEFAASPD